MKRLGIINIDFGKLSGLMDLCWGMELSTLKSQAINQQESD